MHIIVAPDSFKGSLSALEAANSIEAGILREDSSIHVEKIPLSDGGEGFVEALVNGRTGRGRIISLSVRGPLRGRINSFFGMLDENKTAVIEMAAAAGLHLVPESQRNPLEASTFGVGELLKAALDLEPEKIIIGIGGSATNDGGMGLAQALGVRFFSHSGALLGTGAAQLEKIASIDISGLDKRLEKSEVIAACDVKNPLCGPEGATFVYGPQKGVLPGMLERLDNGLEQYALSIKEALGIDIRSIPGSGASGGLGGGLMAFAGARLQPGIDLVLEYSGFKDKIKNADLLITGEGRTDGQTGYGKAPAGLAAAAAVYNVPVICLSGALGEGYETLYDRGIDAAFSCLNEPVTLEKAMDKETCSSLLDQKAFSLTRLISRFTKS